MRMFDKTNPIQNNYPVGKTSLKDVERLSKSYDKLGVNVIDTCNGYKLGTYWR